MIQEEKQLLLKDLCARLQYGVQIYCEKGESKFNFTLYGIRGKMLISKTTYEEKTYSKGIVSKHFEYPIYSSFLKIICKPYLRPMSSMTEEERIKFSRLLDVRYCAEDWEGHISTSYCIEIDNVYTDDEGAIKYPSSFSMDAIDWLNTHHFDYRGLIPMGLALEAPEGMYNT